MKKITLIASILFLAFTAKAQFEGSFTMTIESSEKKNRSFEMHMTVKGDKSMMEISNMPTQTKSIMNKADQTMVMLMDRDGKKMAIKMSMKPMADKVTDTKSDMKFTETGATKVIDGYNCKQMIGEDAEAKVDMWLTTDLNMSMVDLMGTANAAQRGGGMKNFYTGKGISLESTVTTKKNNSVTVMRLKDIKKTSVPDSTFSLDGYEVMENPMMQH